MMWLNDGHFTFTIDDPYIHLALAENIAQGHYGLEPGEPAAPSSGVLWPFLLVPFAKFPWAPWAVLAINILCSLGTIRCADRVFAGLLPQVGGAARLVHSVLLVCFVLATNLVGIALTGMEHSLQVLLACAVGMGLCELARGKGLPRGFLLCLLLSPLVRYENLSLTVAACCMLWCNGMRALAARTVAATAALLGAFSCFLVWIGLHALPTSVRAKMYGFRATDQQWQLFKNLNVSLESDRGVLAAATMVVLACIALFGTRPRMGHLAASMAVAIGLHLFFGQFGWAHRYEIYLWACSLLVMATVVMPEPKLLLERQGWAPRVLSVAVLLLVTCCHPYLYGLRRVPRAGNNIHQQQYQLRRFATEFLDGKVAVNDIGLVAWRNEVPVLDLYGLGSERILTLRRHAAEQPGWMGPVVAAHGARAAMVYEQWFENQIPAHWIRIGKLHLGSYKVYVAESEVSFFATSPDWLEEVRSAARAFAADLPGGVRFEFD